MMSPAPIRTGLSVALCLAAFGWSRTAEANLILSFDRATYSASQGGTTTVQVLLSQDSTGPQVGVGDELTSGDIALTFATTGAASVLSDNNVSFGPAWFAGISSHTTSGSNTIFNVSLLSLGDISDLSGPLLLASFQFTGISAGSTTISVAQFDPTSQDFGTIKGDVADPLNTPTAVITVAAAVAEPASLAMVTLAFGLLGSARGLRRALAARRSA